MASSKHTCQEETGPGDSGGGRDGELFVARRLQLHQQRDRLPADLTQTEIRRQQLTGSAEDPVCKILKEDNNMLS